jgi:FdhE protein
MSESDEQQGGIMENRSESWSQQLDKDVERLKELDYIPEKHLKFFESISRAHIKAKDALSEHRIYAPLDKKKGQDILSQGFPLLSFDRMKLKVETLKVHFKEICGILAKNEDAEPGDIETFSKSEECEKLDLKEFIGKTVSQNGDYLKSLSKKTGIDENSLRFMAITLARPLFELAASEAEEVLESYLWWKNYCPACGSEPLMAKVRKGDNMRILGCSLCGTQWRFDRVKCPFCDHHDPSGKTIKHFYYHEGSPHRLYVCDKCKRYIKCVDERKMELGKEINFAIEDMATLYLDALAKEKGYVPGWNTQGADDQEATLSNQHTGKSSEIQK